MLEQKHAPRIVELLTGFGANDLRLMTQRGVLPEGFGKDLGTGHKRYSARDMMAVATLGFIVDRRFVGENGHLFDVAEFIADWLCDHPEVVEDARLQARLSQPIAVSPRYVFVPRNRDSAAPYGPSVVVARPAELPDGLPSGLIFDLAEIAQAFSAGLVDLIVSEPRD